jgi:hypothetical protein
LAGAGAASFLGTIGVFEGMGASVGMAVADGLAARGRVRIEAELA